MLNRKWLRELSDLQRAMISMFGVDLFAARHPDEIADMDEHGMMDAILACPAHFTSAITGTFSAALTLKETLTSAEQPFIDTADPGLQAIINQGATTTVSGVTVSCAQQKAVATSLDLTSLLSVRGATVSFSGLKVKYAIIRNPVANANPITAKFGSATPASTFGAAWVLVLSPGDVYAMRLLNSETVSASLKLWDLTGTGAQPLDILMGAG